MRSRVNSHELIFPSEFLPNPLPGPRKCVEKGWVKGVGKDIHPRGGPVFTDEKLKNDIKGLLRSAVKFAEPQVKDIANQAIAQSLKDGKGAISAGALLKALPTK